MGTSERIDGPTPNGGTYSIAHWRAWDGGPTTKEKAVAAEILEYDAKGREVFRSYVHLSPAN